MLKELRMRNLTKVDYEVLVMGLFCMIVFIVTIGLIWLIAE